MFLGCLHQLEEVSVMLLRRMTINTYIIMYGDNAGEMVCCLVHSHLIGVLEHLQIKWHTQVPASAIMYIESGQI